MTDMQVWVDPNIFGDKVAIEDATKWERYTANIKAVKCVFYGIFQHFPEISGNLQSKL